MRLVDVRSTGCYDGAFSTARCCWVLQRRQHGSIWGRMFSIRGQPFINALRQCCGSKDICEVLSRFIFESKVAFMMGDVR